MGDARARSSDDTAIDDALPAAGDLLHTPTRSPSKGRSLSDVAPMLSPSPRLRERAPAAATKDDAFVSLQPLTPRRSNLPMRGLSLQMPSSTTESLTSASITAAAPGLTHQTTATATAPPSPQLDLSSIYGSPSSVLPRRSRGLDFSRACTNLHHSTLAEQSSPDLSPTLSGRGIMIPPRKGMGPGAYRQESPGSHPCALWSHVAVPERASVAGSVSSVNMLESDSAGSSSNDEELMEHDEPGEGILTTPQVYKLGHPPAPFSASNPFAPAGQNSPGGDWMGRYSPAAASLLSFQRAQLRRGRSRKSSSSASASVSGGSAMASPSPASPPVAKSIESMHGYFGRDAVTKTAPSRRSSLSWGTKELHLSSGGESDESPASAVGQPAEGADPVTPVTPGPEEKRSVIRRPVTRRGNLLPKSKNFARIQAALMEEGAPVDSEVKREAEVVRQVRESDTELDLDPPMASADAGHSSPTAFPAVPGVTELLEDFSGHEMLGDGHGTTDRDKAATEWFSLQAKKQSAGRDFWKRFDATARTPPPVFPRGGSSVMGDDVGMESPTMTATSASASVPMTGASASLGSGGSQWSTPLPSVPPLVTEVSRKVHGKRRRDDDLDASSFKRRAVSPGMSLQNSPVLSQSPVHKDPSWWGVGRGGRELPPAATSGGPPSERSGGGGSVNGGNVNASSSKRVGFQGMSDTNDGLMKMSIE